MEKTNKDDRHVMDLLKLSREFGKDPAHVQGGGGNTSCKTSGHEMLIKASGSFLSEMTTSLGYLRMDTKDFVSLLENEAGQENYDKALKEASQIISGAERRPSMESGFHAILGRAVLHTHSVYANVLNCSKQGMQILKEIFASREEIEYVEYLNPGYELSCELHHLAKGKKDLPRFFFLQNHGVISSAPSPGDAIALYQEVHAQIIDFLGEFKPFTWQEPKAEENFYRSYSPTLLEYLSGNPTGKFDQILFPDQAVYTHMAPSSGTGIKKISLDKDGLLYNSTLKEAIAIDQTLSAYAFIMREIERIGLSPRTIELDDIAFILNLSSEKFRQAKLS